MKIAWLPLVTLAACTADKPAPPAEQARVVALVPAATEIIAALGRSDALVGRAEEDTARYVAHLPSAGTVLSPSIERVVALQPDVVIAWPEADPLLEHMRSLGARTLAVRFERVSDVAANIRSIGRLLAVPHTADSLAEHITAELEWLRQTRARRGWPTVLYLLDTQPFWTAGPNTFVDDLIRLAGGINIFADLPTQWSEVSLEGVIARRPDVIIVAQPDKGGNARDWLDDAGWRRLHAVQNRRVYFVDADLFNRAGPNVVETAHRLATILQSGSPE